VSEHSVRPARPADVTRLIEIEDAAGERFREIGMDAVADDPSPSPDEMFRLVAAGVIRVVDIDGRAAGYLQAEVGDDCAHGEPASADPAHIGRRVLGDDEITPGLAALRAEETRRGLDRWPRCCMRLDLR